jgi:DNA/RNA endonuclease G (NUC1)
MISDCNLTAPSPPSQLPQIGLEKPKGYSNPNQAPEHPSARAINDRNLLLGNPSNAAPCVASIDNYLMVKPQFVMSYNSKTKTANWVS